MRGTQKLIVIAILVTALLLGGCFSRKAAPTGTLLVNYPQALTVQIDGQARGSANQPISAIPAGKHSIALVHNENAVWSSVVVITGGQTLTISPSIETPQLPTPQPPPPTSSEPSPPKPPDEDAYKASLVADFAERDAMPETLIPESKWVSYGKYGPPAAHFPAPAIPAEYDRLQWQRDRVVAVARKYIGKVPYEHKHIPSLGLDCSNFTAWVYNYGLGIKFTSTVSKQGAEVGRKLSKDEPLQPGDLLFFQNDSGSITHAAIYIEPGYMIDESGNVAIKRFPHGWTATAFAHARRVIE